MFNFIRVKQKSFSKIYLWEWGANVHKSNPRAASICERQRKKATLRYLKDLKTQYWDFKKSQNTPCITTVYLLGLTLNHKFSGALCLAQGVHSHHFVLPTVLGVDSEDVHGADAVGVGDVVVVVRVDAGVVEVPHDAWRRAAPDSTGHEELVAFRRGVNLQWYQDGWGSLKVDFHHWVCRHWDCSRSIDKLKLHRYCLLIHYVAGF